MIVDLDSPNLRQLRPSGQSHFLPGARLYYLRGGRRTLVSRCDVFCAEVQLGAGLITWAQGARTYAYNVQTGTRYSWLIDPNISPNSAAGVVHIAHTVFLEGKYSPDGSLWYMAKL
jgi:hypothetical protein